MMPRFSEKKDMTGWEYKKILSELGLSQSAAARFFGRSSTSGREWGDLGPPLGVSKMLRYMAATGLTTVEANRALGEGEDIPPCEDQRLNAKFRQGRVEEVA